MHELAGVEQSNYLVVMKGAPERIIERCDSILVGNKVEIMTDHWREQFNNAYLELGGLGERVLGTFGEFHFSFALYVFFMLNSNSSHFLCIS